MIHSITETGTGCNQWLVCKNVQRDILLQACGVFLPWVGVVHYVMLLKSSVFLRIDTLTIEGFCNFVDSSQPIHFAVCSIFVWLHFHPQLLSVHPSVCPSIRPSIHLSTLLRFVSLSRRSYMLSTSNLIHMSKLLRHFKWGCVWWPWLSSNRTILYDYSFLVNGIFFWYWNLLYHCFN